MNLLKTLRPAAYALLGMIGLTLSAQAQLLSDSNPISETTAKELGATQNQANLAVALGKGGENFYSSLPNTFWETAQFDNNGNLINGTAQQQAYFNGANKLNSVLYPVYTGNETQAQLDAIDANALQLTKSFLNQLSPGLYTALPTILFNSANVQNTQIQQRLWAVRAGMSQDQVEAPVSDGGKSATLSGKKVVAPVAEPEQKWVTFADGNGMWSQAQSINNLPGYNTYGGGVQIGATYEFLKGLSVGPYVGYQGTRVNFNGSNGGGSSATQNSVRYGLMGEYQKGGWYTDGIVGGAYNSVDVNHGINISGNGNTFSSMANGNVAGGEFDSMLGTGYEFKAGKLTFGPATSLQYTYLQLGGTTETGAGPLNQTIGSQNASSLLYTLGGQASYTIDLTQSVKLQPFASLAWQHEFLQNGYNLTSSILGQSYNYQTTNPGRDQYIAGIGGNLVLSKSISAYAVCNLINGDQRIFSQAISGGINWKF
jgi:outer membrane autotransporter protein